MGKIIQIASQIVKGSGSSYYAVHLTALCDDGTVWQRVSFAWFSSEAWNPEFNKDHPWEKIDLES